MTSLLLTLFKNEFSTVKDNAIFFDRNHTALTARHPNDVMLCLIDDSRLLSAEHFFAGLSLHVSYGRNIIERLEGNTNDILKKYLKENKTLDPQIIATLVERAEVDESSFKEAVLNHTSNKNLLMGMAKKAKKDSSVLYMAIIFSIDKEIVDYLFANSTNFDMCVYALHFTRSRNEKYIVKALEEDRKLNLNCLCTHRTHTEGYLTDLSCHYRQLKMKKK